MIYLNRKKWIKERLILNFVQVESKINPANAEVLLKKACHLIRAELLFKSFFNLDLLEPNYMKIILPEYNRLYITENMNQAQQ